MTFQGLMNENEALGLGVVNIMLCRATFVTGERWSRKRQNGRIITARDLTIDIQTLLMRLMTCK